jgi:hypothetical protein
LNIQILDTGIVFDPTKPQFIFEECLIVVDDPVLRRFLLKIIICQQKTYALKKGWVNLLGLFI